MLQSVTFWYAISFVLFLAVVYFKGWKSIKEGLDQKISDITNDIDDAEKLKNQAQKKYLEARSSFKNSKEVEISILDAAAGQADFLKSDSRQKLDEIIKFKNLAFEHQKEEVEGRLIQEIRHLIIEKAISLSYKELAKIYSGSHVDDYFKKHLPYAIDRISELKTLNTN